MLIPGRATQRFADLSPEQRSQARAVREDLLEVLLDHRERQGWHDWELDPLTAEARRLGVYVWPALVKGIQRDLRAS